MHLTIEKYLTTHPIIVHLVIKHSITPKPSISSSKIELYLDLKS